MKKRVLAMSIQAMFGGYWTDSDYGPCFRFNQRDTGGTKLKVRFRIPPNPEDSLDFTIFLSPENFPNGK